MQDSYKDYQPADFLKDEKFLRWRLLGDEEDRLFWEGFLNEYPEREPVLREAVRLMEGIKLNSYVYTAAEKQELWQRIERKIRRRHLVRGWGYAASLAACVVVLISVLWMAFPSVPCPDLKSSVNVDSLLQADNVTVVLADGRMLPVASDGGLQYTAAGLSYRVGSECRLISAGRHERHVLAVPRGKTFFISFEDGTRVWVNSETALLYPVCFKSREREMEVVTGEAYVEVAENRHAPFVVHTCRFDIHVLGTRFDVSAYKGENTHSLVLAQGKVKISSSRLRHPVFLEPDEMFSAEKDSCFTSWVDAEDYICWKDGLLTVRSQPLSAIVRKLSRHYDADIRLAEGIRELKCSGKIVLFPDLDVTLENIAKVLPVAYVRCGGGILITPKH